jgi:hypothetical protein
MLSLNPDITLRCVPNSKIAVDKTNKKKFATYGIEGNTVYCISGLNLTVLYSEPEIVPQKLLIMHTTDLESF